MPFFISPIVRWWQSSGRTGHPLLRRATRWRSSAATTVPMGLGSWYGCLHATVRRPYAPTALWPDKPAQKRQRWPGACFRRARYYPQGSWTVGWQSEVVGRQSVEKDRLSGLLLLVLNDSTLSRVQGALALPAAPYAPRPPTGPAHLLVPSEQSLTLGSHLPIRHALVGVSARSPT